MTTPGSPFATERVFARRMRGSVGRREECAWTRVLQHWFSKFVFFDKASRKHYQQHPRSWVSCCRTTALLSSGANRHDNKDGLGYDSLRVRLTIPVRRSFFYDDLNCTLLSAAMAGPGKTGLKETLKMGTLPTPHTQNNDSNRPHVFSLHRHATR